MIRKFVRILAVTLSLAASLALSQSVALAATESLQLTGTNNGFSMGGVYTSPYVITVNGKSTLLLACDDFTKDISIDTRWDADRITLAEAATKGKFSTQSDVVAIPTALGTSTTDTTYKIGEKYNAAGWLAEKLMTTSLNDATLAGQYSFAIWQIFYSGAINGANGTNPLTVTDEIQVGNFMRAAFDPARTALTHSVYLYTPKPLDSSQEFIGISDSLTINSVPEASTTAFLAFNFLALPCFLSVVRRRYRGASK